MRSSEVIALVSLVLIALLLVVLWHQHRRRSRLGPKCPLNLNAKADRQLLPSDRKLVAAVKARAPIEAPPSQQKIPRTIHQTFARDEIPENRRRAIETVLSRNGSYAYKYYNDAECREYISRHMAPEVLRAFDALIPGKYKADLFRYCVLYTEGGVYLDTAFVCEAALDTIIDPEDSFVTAIDRVKDALYNAIIASVPKHAILRTAIDICVQRIGNREYGDSALYPTGPKVLASAFRQVMNTEELREGKYPGGVKLLSNKGGWGCLVRKVSYHGRTLFHTKYASSTTEPEWYLPQYRHHRLLWQEKNIYTGGPIAHTGSSPAPPREVCPWGAEWHGWDSVKDAKDKSVVEVPANVPPREQGHRGGQRIPRVIHQTHNKSAVPTRMKKAIDSILALNPEYAYRYYDEGARQRFLREHFPPEVGRAYASLVPGAYRSDLFRYCVLYIHGGVYVDAGFVALKPLRDSLPTDSRFLATADIKPGDVLNGFMAAKPRHPIIKRVLEIVLERISRRDYGANELYITGPMALGKAFQDVVKKPPTEGDFGQGVVLGQYVHGDKCVSGSVLLNGEAVFHSKYPEYREDSKWYCGQEAYGVLWWKRRVFGES